MQRIIRKLKYKGIKLNNLNLLDILFDLLGKLGAITDFFIKEDSQ